jgi:hypothetical protein
VFEVSDFRFSIKMTGIVAAEEREVEEQRAYHTDKPNVHQLDNPMHGGRGRFSAA